MAQTGYSQTPGLVKGALLYFGASMLIPIPSLIVFQYNPESLTRTLVPFQPIAKVNLEKKIGADGKEAVTNQAAYDEYLAKVATLSQPYDPQETFSLGLELDATDLLEEPGKHPVASITGVADRLAAIEMLMYPPGDSLLGGALSAMASASISVGGFSASASIGLTLEKITRKDAPVVLFFWGIGRIVPVRITSLSIEEQQFLPSLYPLRAKATLGVRVLDLDDLTTMAGDPASGAAVEIARGCYKFTRAQKELLATANLLNAGEFNFNVLPF